MEHINNVDQTEEVRTRVILDNKIKEKFPISYDLVEELLIKINELKTMLYLDVVKGFDKYDEILLNRYVAFKMLLNAKVTILVMLTSSLSSTEVISEMFSLRATFNLVFNEETQRHVESFKACKDTNKAWELFNRIEYLINNFETEILLSDTEDTEDV